MSDPVEIIAEELRVQRETSAPTDSATNAGAWLILNTLHEAGWRIMRTNGGGSKDDPDWGSVTFVYVDEEWTP